MKTLEEALSHYAGYHRDPRNIATHFVGVPMIVLAVAALLLQLGVIFDHLDGTVARYRRTFTRLGSFYDKASDLVREIPFAVRTSLLVFDFKVVVLAAVAAGGGGCCGGRGGCRGQAPPHRGGAAHRRRRRRPPPDCPT